jgi:hypothetical protein
VHVRVLAGQGPSPAVEGHIERAGDAAVVVIEGDEPVVRVIAPEDEAHLGMGVLVPEEL